MPIAALKEVVRSLRSTNAATGQFKQVAAESNKNVGKISKDLYSLFNVQKKESTALNNSIQEVVNESQQTGAKVDNTNKLIQESMGIQTTMLSELKNITITLKQTNDLLRFIGGSNIDPSTIMSTSPAGIAARRLGIAALGMGVAGAAGAAAIGMNSSSPANSIPDTNYTAESKEARSAADKYRGKPLTDNEWSELVRATNAEAGRKNQTEIAMVMASILNRSRDSNKTVEQVLREPKQFTAVTGNNGQGVAQFHQNPTTGRATQIYGAAANILNNVDKSQKNFQSAHSAAYNANGDGGNGDAKIQDKLNKGYSRVGDSIFNTAPPTTKMPSTKESGGMPSGDIKALGKMLQDQGLRVSEHPEFGGVNPVHKGKAHYEGRAIDLNVGRGNVEANDPVMGARFDKLADQLRAAGYKVIWRSSGHYDHMHIEAPVGMPKLANKDTSESPDAVSNQGDGSKANKPASGAASFPTMKQQAGEALSKASAPLTSTLGATAATMVDNVTRMFSPKGSTAETTPVAIPAPVSKEAETKTESAQAVQSMAVVDKVKESVAQEATVERSKETSTPIDSPIERREVSTKQDYNADNDLSIFGDGWVKDTLSYFGVIGNK